MRPRSARIPLFVTILATTLALLCFRPEELSHVTSDSQARSGSKAKDQSSAGSSAAAGGSVVHTAHSASPAPRISRVIPVNLEVVAPLDAHVGEILDTRIDAQIGAGIQDLLFTVRYDKRRVALVGWAPGTLLRGDAFAAELGVQEPSDGNVEIAFRSGDGRFISGAGSIVALHFEAVNAGTSAIALANVMITDRLAASEQRSVNTQEKVMTIH
jgi:hypothetical protein